MSQCQKRIGRVESRFGAVDVYCSKPARDGEDWCRFHQTLRRYWGKRGEERGRA